MSKQFNDYEIKLNLLALSLPEAQTLYKDELNAYMLDVWSAVSDDQDISKRVAQFEYALLTGGTEGTSMAKSAPGLYDKAESIVNFYEQKMLTKSSDKPEMSVEIGGVKLSRTIGLNLALNQYLMDDKAFIKRGTEYLNAIGCLDTRKGKIGVSRLINEDKLSKKIAGVVAEYGKKFADIGLDYAVGVSSKADLLSLPGIQDAAIKCFNRIGVMAYRFLSKIGVVKKGSFSKTRQLYRYLKGKKVGAEKRRGAKVYALGMSMAFVAGVAVNPNFEAIMQDLSEVKDMVVASTESQFNEVVEKSDARKAMVYDSGCEIPGAELAVNENMNL